MRDAMPAGPGVELLSRGQVRALKIAIVVMGVLILGGLLVLIARVIYLASLPARQAAPAPAVSASVQLALPAGAVVRNVALSGERLAVHYDAAAGPGIAILDLGTGRIVGRVTLSSEAPASAR